MASSRGGGRPRNPKGPAGLAPKEIARHIAFGSVFIVVDRAISFPMEEVTGRTTHPGRWCIVVQQTAWGRTKDPRTVLVVPCSASHVGPVEAWDLRLPAMDCFDKPNVVAYTSLVQPVLKSKLEKHAGYVTAQVAMQVRERLARLIDLVEIPDEELTDADDEP